MDYLFDVMCFIVIVGGFSLLLLVFDAMMNLIYKLFPKFKRRVEAYLESLPEWED